MASIGLLTSLSVQTLASRPRSPPVRLHFSSRGSGDRGAPVHRRVADGVAGPAPRCCRSAVARCSRTSPSRAHSTRHMRVFQCARLLPRIAGTAAGLGPTRQVRGGTTSAPRTAQSMGAPGAMRTRPTQSQDRAMEWLDLGRSSWTARAAAPAQVFFSCDQILARAPVAGSLGIRGVPSNAPSRVLEARSTT